MDDISTGKSNSENDTVISCMISLIGEEVFVETTDNSKYTGTLAACSSEFNIGLRNAQKCPVNESHNGCLVDVIEKIEFKSKDVVTMYGPMKEMEKSRAVNSVEKGFAIDQEISKSVPKKEEELEKEFQEWVPEEDDNTPGEEWQTTARFSSLNSSRSVYSNNRLKNSQSAWSPEEMLRANKSLGVETSFREDLSQYTTVEVKGDDFDRRKADAIASQIENNVQSRRNAMLEDDDNERDLNVETNFESEKNGDDFIPINHRRSEFDSSNHRGHTRDEVNSSFEAWSRKRFAKKAFVFNPNAAPFVPKK